MTTERNNGQPRADRGVRRAGILLSLVVLVATACGGSATATPAGTPAVTLALSADHIKFNSSSLSVPAGSPFAILFENLETGPHNVVIRGAPWTVPTEIFSGPGQRTYVFPALPAGSYTFQCEVHPEMTGTLTVS